MKSGCALLSAALFVFLAGSEPPPGQERAPQAQRAAKTMDRGRLSGMKAAIADLEAGKLKIRSAPLPEAAWQGAYLDLLQKECGIAWETETSEKAGMEMGGYNDVMIMEIEHRFGKGILETLQKKAEASFRRTTDN